MREDLLDRYHVDEIRVKEFKDVYSFNPPSADIGEIDKAELYKWSHLQPVALYCHVT